MDAGEREEPGRTMPVGREFVRSRGRLASTSPAGFPSCRGGPWLNTMARTPAASATWARTGEKPRCTPGPLHRCLPGTRDPRTFFLPVAPHGVAKPRGASRVPGPSTDLETQDDSITGGSHRPECGCVSGVCKPVLVLRRTLPAVAAQHERSERSSGEGLILSSREAASVEGRGRAYQRRNARKRPYRSTTGGNHTFAPGVWPIARSCETSASARWRPITPASAPSTWPSDAPACARVSVLAIRSNGVAV